MKKKPKTGMSLEVTQEDGKTAGQHAAELAATGLASNAFATTVFAQPSGMLLGEHLGDVHRALKAAVERTKTGTTDQADELLTAQAVTLNQVFVEMLRRAALNMGEHLGATETYMRLALKAQSQCRATLESLSEIRNPRSVAFVRQANIAAGHQQVNNGVAAAGEVQGPVGTDVGNARPATGSQPNELFSEVTNVTRLDPAAKGTASPGHRKVEAVAAGNRAADGRRKGDRVA